MLNCRKYILATIFNSLLISCYNPDDLDKHYVEPVWEFSHNVLTSCSSVYSTHDMVMFRCKDSTEMTYECFNVGIHEVWAYGTPGAGHRRGVSTFVEFNRDNCQSRIGSSR